MQTRYFLVPLKKIKIFNKLGYYIINPFIEDVTPTNPSKAQLAIFERSSLEKQLLKIKNRIKLNLFKAQRFMIAIR